MFSFLLVVVCTGHVVSQLMFTIFNKILSSVFLHFQYSIKLPVIWIKMTDLPERTTAINSVNYVVSSMDVIIGVSAYSACLHMYRL